MMKNIGWHVLIFSTTYLLLHLFQNNAIGPELVRFYLKDILLIPMLLFSIGIVSSLFRLHLAIGNKEVFLAFIYCVLAFEVIVPALNETRKFDWLDILAYGLGAIFYLYFYKQHIRGILLENLQNEKE